MTFKKVSDTIRLKRVRTQYYLKFKKLEFISRLALTNVPHEKNFKEIIGVCYRCYPNNKLNRKGEKMKSFCLFKENLIANIFYENSEPDGVKRVADTVSEDLFLVTNKKPNIINSLEECKSEQLIIVATIGQSDLIDMLEIDTSKIIGKRECYLMKVMETPFENFPNIKKALLIIGSDKRGTIYGMFRLSELCGVSPLVFWGDAMPQKKKEVTLEFDSEIISKEPSVKYRGFFINDEWPAFGNWCVEHYGDVNAKAYDKIFELVLRLKGNYFWPAMWDSSFWQDGPSIENARLADEYGVIIGTSHHEPLCRAGVEWQRQYQNYGDDNTWNFVSNRESIVEFWKDGVKRSKNFENVITLGMRGENDSKLMADATLQDNINVIKDAITTQYKLIKENVNSNLEDVPRMLAIYKEVEDFYFGAQDTEGLRDWKELEDVILLLSDDNHGNLRAIPQPDDKPHRGGYGIYYHFDYHGSPFSYEWFDGTNLAKVWEQLTTAYEHDIREMWIVNVGDIKGNEYPLSFFMDLAYDFEKWGTTRINSATDYTKQWIDTQFDSAVSDSQKTQINNILDGYMRWSGIRILESLNSEVFQNNFYEIENTRKDISEIMLMAESLRKELPKESLSAFESMIYFPVTAVLNTILINAESAMNHISANRGASVANEYAREVREKIALDNYYVNEFHKILNGKWNHMMSSAHMGFRTWDDNDWAYPTIQEVYPIPFPKIMVSFRGDDRYDLGNHWQNKEPFCNSEMTRPDKNSIILDIDSRGDVDFNFSISCNKDWLAFSKLNGEVDLKKNPRTSIEIRCERNSLIGEDTAFVHIDFDFKDGTKKWTDVSIKAGNKDYSKYQGAFLGTQNYLCMHAKNYVLKKDVDNMGWRIVSKLGRMSDAIKSFPINKNWENENNRPFVQYDFILDKIANEPQEYVIEFYLSPRNPKIKGGTMKACFSINDEESKLFDVVPADYYAEWIDYEWSFGVTNNIRIVRTMVSISDCFNSLKFYAADPNVILEKIVMYAENTPIPPTHLAPPESYRIDNRNE